MSIPKLGQQVSYVIDKGEGMPVDVRGAVVDIKETSYFVHVWVKDDVLGVVECRLERNLRKRTPLNSCFETDYKNALKGRKILAPDDVLFEMAPDGEYLHETVRSAWLLYVHVTNN